MPRTFIAIETPDSLKADVTQLHTRIPGVRWTPPQQIHLTVSFLGDTPDELIPEIRNALDKIPFSAFTLSCSATGFFPLRGRPSVFWLGFTPCPALGKLKNNIDEALLPIGFLPEKRPFSPHLTLARLKASLGREMPARLENLAKRLPIQEIAVSSFCLFGSRILPQGAEHSILAQFQAKN